MKDRSVGFSTLIFRIAFFVYFLVVLAPSTPFFLPETFLLIAFVAFLLDRRPDWGVWWNDSLLFWLGLFVTWLSLTSLLDGLLLSGGYLEWFQLNPTLALLALFRNLPFRLILIVFVFYHLIRDGNDWDRNFVRLLLWVVFVKFLLIGYSDYIANQGWITGVHFQAYAHYNLTGSLMNLFIPLVLCELHFNKTLTMKVALVLLFYLGITGIFMTQSRGSILSLIFSLGCFTAIYLYRNFSRRTLVIANVMGIVALGLFFYNPSREFVRQRFEKTTFRGWEGIRETGSPIGGLSGRLTRIWPRTVTALSDRPLTGYMLGSYPDVLDRYYGEDREGDYRHPHNFYLQLLFHGGVVGFVLFVVFSLQFFRRVLGLLRVDRAEVLYGLAAGVAGFSEMYFHGLVAMFDYTWLIFVLPWLFLVDALNSSRREE